MRKLKSVLSKLLNNVTLPVMSSQLKGIKLKVSSLMPGNLFYNNVEPQVHDVYNIFFKPGFVFFDIGANIGLHSYYISRRFLNSKVVAFEPLPENAAYIRRSIKLNNIENITLIEKAVADKPGTTNFDRSINNHQGKITSNVTGFLVNQTSIDTYISDTNIRPDLIKIDVEGAEALVLAGFKDHISIVAPILVIEVHDKNQSDQVLEYFKSLEYKLCRLMHSYRKGNKFFGEIHLGNLNENIVGQVVAIPNKVYNNYSKYIA